MEFVDGRANRHYHKRGPRYGFGVGARHQGAAGENFPEQRFTAFLKKRQTARCYCLQRRFIRIGNRCFETVVREHERERQADVAGATDDANIAVAIRHFGHRSMCPRATAMRIAARFKALEKAGSPRIKFRSGLS